MSSIRELSVFEVAQVSGGGNAGDHDCSSSSNSGSKIVIFIMALTPAVLELSGV